MWAFASLVIAVTLVYLTMIVPTLWLDVVHVNARLGVGKRALQITDVHVEMLRVQPNRLRDIARQEQVDYIFFTGDFLTKDNRLSKVNQVLHALATVGVPMFAVLGNHDYHMRNVKALLDLLQHYNVTLLLNRAIQVDGFWLVGIDDLTTKHSNPTQAFKGVPAAATESALGSGGLDGCKGPRVIVLAHDPNVVLDIRQRFSYLMSGHLHGKQFAIPGLFYIKRMGALPKSGIYKGLHRLPMGLIYISKGLSQVGVNLRFLVRCEVTIHDL